jgi:hypothetical protein
MPLEAAISSMEPTRTPSLLPAFEPFSSSPVLPRPSSSKRKFGENSPSSRHEVLKYYPTPVPTSSTGMPPSSPQHSHACLERTISMLSERRPLGAVPIIDLPADGEIIKMGRSSNSSDYQLSANRLISRVHVQAAYHAPDASHPSGYVELECLGWNGAKVHCKGCLFVLTKGDTYMTENKEAEIMLDVQNTRVIIAWPVISTKSSWDSDDDTTPTRRRAQDPFTSSPPMALRSPVSISPIRQPVFTTDPAFTHERNVFTTEQDIFTTEPVMTIGHIDPAQNGSVQVFEDADAVAACVTPTETTFIQPVEPRSSNSTRDAKVLDPKASFMNSFDENASFNENDDLSDGDEENDPVVHSFGPSGENLLPRFASFSAESPGSTIAQRRRRLTAWSSPKSAPAESVLFKNSPIKNHFINQLAYSRLHSQPLSAIHSNLPAELKVCVTKSQDDKVSDSGESTPVPQFSKQDLKKLLDETPCVGEIPRSGKDAAGQPLENEFYYVPEMDSDTTRRETVTMGMRGAGGLRAVRKQHKVRNMLTIPFVLYSPLIAILLEEAARLMLRNFARRYRYTLYASSIINTLSTVPSSFV